MTTNQIIEGKPVEIAVGEWGYRIDLNTQPYPRKGATIRVRTKTGKTFDKKYSGQVHKENRKAKEVIVLAN